MGYGKATRKCLDERAWWLLTCIRLIGMPIETHHNDIGNIFDWNTITNSQAYWKTGSLWCYALLSLSSVH